MRRLLIYSLVFLLSLLITIRQWPTVNDSNCSATAFLAKKTPKFAVSATKVVVQPWLGEHHVYGIFMVPEQYKQTPFFILSVKDIDPKCSRPFGDRQYFDGVFAEPRTYLVKDYIRTRTAIQLILKGLYFQLNDPKNWTLIFPEINPNQKNTQPS
ncbi:MAG TPA: hypothetical protein VK203_26885 [Nostocaceae cyanobacterium]|nr:hypothetical protein [Nostocaceae cyanobacterium]